MEAKDFIVRAVAFPHGPHWVAQCLDYDIATQARTLDELLYELERILVAHIRVAEREGLEPFSELPRAPKRFWEMYRRARTKVQAVSAQESTPSRQRTPTMQVAFSEAA